MKDIYILVLGVFITITALGCSQNPEEGGGDPATKGQTATTQGGTTVQAKVQEQTTAEQETTREETTSREDNAQQGNDSQQNGGSQRGNNARQGQGGGQIEITMNAPPGQQNQQSQQGQQPQQTVTVRIAGTEGVPFSGRVGSAQGLRRVEGSIPEEYEVTFGGAAVTAAIRKQEPGQGTVRVEMVRDGNVVASQESASTTGVVNLVWTPR